MSELATNVWADVDEIGDGIRGKRLERVPDETLAAAVWELEPGAEIVYHLHHGTRELIVVLKGTVTLRTADGERELREGETVAFPRGLPGAHGTANRTDAPVRYLMVAAHDPLDVIEYPDKGTLLATARTTSHTNEPLEWYFRFSDAVAGADT